MRIIGFILLFAGLVSANELYLEANPIEEFLEFNKGVFKALNVNHEFDILTKCIYGSQPLIKEYVEIFDRLLEFDPTKIMELVNLIIKAVNDTKTYFETCAGADDEFMKLVVAIFNVDIFSLIQKIIVEQQVLLKYIQDFINAVSVFNAGEAFGKVIYKLFLENDLLGELGKPIFEFEDFIAMVEGYFEVILNNKTVYDDIDKCLRQFPEVYKSFVRAIQLLQELDFTNPMKIIDALMQLCKSFINLFNATKGCSNFPKVFEEMIEKFLNVSVQEVFQRLMKNFPKVVSHFSLLVNNISEGKFKEAGQEIGKIIHILIYNKIEIPHALLT